MNSVLKKTCISILIIICVISILILSSFINHKIKLKQESVLFQPLGEIVSVDDHNMHIYTEGSGEFTLVFLSGGGTCSPTLDFKSLYSQLNNDYRIAVVEKIGYGFSDVATVPRDIDTILEETRKALTLAGESAPYILFPHSLSGIEALYWAQKYPNELVSIMGLDPAVPKVYE